MLDRIDRGNTFKLIIAAIGGYASYLFGGWDKLIQVLLAFVVIDYIAGILASGIEGKLSSSIGMKGIAKKVFIFIIVACANFVDGAIGDGSVMRDAAIFFYIANELLSIIENTGRAGLPVPDILKRAVDVLKGKAKQKEG